MSVDREYGIKITLRTDNSGATQAKGALDELGGAAKKTGEEGEKSAEGMFEKHHELHKLIHAMGETAVPGMGRAFASLAGGPIGAVIALATAAEFVKREIEGIQQKLDELSNGASRAFGGGDWLTDWANAASQAAIETENLELAFEKAAETGDAVKNKYDAEARAIQATVDALKDRLKAQEELDVAAARKSGASPEVIAAMEAQIRARVESQSEGAQAAADHMLQVARQRELYERQQNDEALKNSARQKQTPVEDLVKRQQRQSELAANEGALAKAMSEMNTAANDELKEKIENNQRELERSREIYGKSDPLGLMKKLQDETDTLEEQTAEARAERAKQRIEQLSEQVIKDQQRAVQEKLVFDEAEKASTDNTARIVQLQKDIAQANIVAKIKAESASQLIRNIAGFDGVKEFEKTAGVDTPGGLAQFAGQFQSAIAHLRSRRGNEADRHTVILMNSLLQATQQADHATYAELQKIIQDLTAHKLNTRNNLQQLRMVIDAKGK